MIKRIKAVLKIPFKAYRKIKNKANRFVQAHYFRTHTTIDEELRIKTKRNPWFCVERTATENRVYSLIKIIEKRNKSSEKIKIVFICQFHMAWNACASTFKACLEDPMFDVYLLALPEKVMKTGNNKKVSDIKAEEYEEENIGYQYCKSFFPETINGYDQVSGKWFDLEGLKPAYVVMSRSNQDYLPKQYRSEYLATFTKVIHIPYAYCKMMWDSRAVYRHKLTDYVYAIFTENEMYRDILRNVYHDQLNAKWKKIEFFGYPRFDLYDTEKSNVEHKKPTTVLWLPRWVTASRLEASTFFKYKDVLIDFFLKHSEYKLICRPHPKMFGNFIATGEMSEKEVAEFKELFEQEPNFHLDEYSDYLPSFEEADIFVSDTTSLLVEEYITGKPIIFCGVMHFDADAENWAKYMYQAKNKSELINLMEQLFAENDPQYNKRKEYALICMKHDGKAGKRIAEFIRNDYMKSCT